MKPKIIAFYLPQFHAIPENDKWWGKGFTEWTSVKKSKPLFKDHYQPRVPFKNNYYILTDKNTLLWQTKLARKYKIYGFCFYHYWFKGKKLLEKPSEIFLKNKDIHFRFCFNWANQSWERTWYGSKNETLIRQEYGNKKDWKNHFNYLIPFFKDKRYIKIDNSPVFLIYNSENFKKIDRMFLYWKKLAKKEGFNGIYFIETLSILQNKLNSKFSNGVCYSEPGFTIRYNTNLLTKLNIYIKRLIQKIIPNSLFLIKFNYDKLYSMIIKREINNIKDIFLGCFVDFDSSPRKKNQAFIINNSSPDKFGHYLKKIYNKAEKINSKYIFINAWNEWAEGNYLEPDSKTKFQYLLKIKLIFK